jgi:hypothetical protein
MNAMNRWDSHLWLPSSKQIYHHPDNGRRRKTQEIAQQAIPSAFDSDQRYVLTEKCDEFQSQELRRVDGSSQPQGHARPGILHNAAHSVAAGSLGRALFRLSQH